MWFSGLRGAMAYALALQASITLAIGPVILVTTLVYSLITILGLGTGLYPFLTYMDVKNKPADKEPDQTPNCSNRAKQAISRFDTYYFSPLFIKDRAKIEDRNLHRSESFSANHLVAEMRAKYVGQGYSKMNGEE
jgi:hypothetical protein